MPDTDLASASQPFSTDPEVLALQEEIVLLHGFPADDVRIYIQEGQSLPRGRHIVGVTVTSHDGHKFCTVGGASDESRLAAWRNARDKTAQQVRDHGPRYTDPSVDFSKRIPS